MAALLDSIVVLPDLTTVEQYRQLPDDGNVYELHYGEVVTMSHPKNWHFKLQELLLELLKPRLRGFKIGMELPFRAIREFDLRAADVAAVSIERWVSSGSDDNLHGAPELVIEVKSPSNTKRKLQDYAALCLANGCREFWLVDRDAKTVTVLQRDGSRKTYGIGESLPLAAFGGDALPVAEIFADLTSDHAG